MTRQPPRQFEDDPAPFGDVYLSDHKRTHFPAKWSQISDIAEHAGATHGGVRRAFTTVFVSAVIEKGHK